MVATGETSHLIFQVSALSAKGLLSQQTREALKAIVKANNGAPVVHIRAFVAGSGDLRRVSQIVGEVFGEKKMQLPSVSVVQAGGLPLENAQVAIEAVSVGKKEVNPDGLMFVEAQPAASLEQALEKLASRLSGKTDEELAVYRKRYLETIPTRGIADEIADAHRLFHALAEVGGKSLVGDATDFDDAMYFDPEHN